MRSQNIFFPAMAENDTGKLASLISIFSQNPLASDNGRYSLPPVDSSETPHFQEFVRDRFRYLLATGVSPDFSKILHQMEDVREMQYNSHYTDTWWQGETRAGRTYSYRDSYLQGAQTVARGEVNNSAWEIPLGHVKGRLITRENVANGSITADLINGEGFYRGRDNILRRALLPGYKVSRTYDPVQRETFVPGQEVKRTTGWIQVAEIPLGKSESMHHDVVRRVFWNEADVDGTDRHSPTVPGQEISRGEFRIAQQSLTLPQFLDAKEGEPLFIPSGDPLRKQVQDFLPFKGKKAMPPALMEKLRKRFGHLGEIDPVRGEIVVNIEALVQRGDMVVPLQWKWNPKNQNWERNDWVLDSLEKPENERRVQDNIAFNCRACHSKRNSTLLGGRCTKKRTTEVYFDRQSRNILNRDR
jgi:hypothetical protein